MITGMLRSVQQREKRKKKKLERIAERKKKKKIGGRTIAPIFSVSVAGRVRDGGRR